MKLGIYLCHIINRLEVVSTADLFNCKKLYHILLSSLEAEVLTIACGMTSHTGNFNNLLQLHSNTKTINATQARIQGGGSGAGGVPPSDLSTLFKKF